MGRRAKYSTSEERRIGRRVYMRQYMDDYRKGKELYTDAEVLALRAEIAREVLLEMFTEIGIFIVHPPMTTQEVVALLCERLRIK